MRSGARFLEDYGDPNADIRQLDDWLLGKAGLYAYLQQLGSERPHGGAFRYRSSETDVLGWVCERASGSRMAELIGDLVWAPMGAESDAEIQCDSLEPRSTTVGSGPPPATCCVSASSC